MDFKRNHLCTSRLLTPVCCKVYLLDDTYKFFVMHSEIKQSSFIFQNEEIFGQSHELDELDKITHA